MAQAQRRGLARGDTATGVLRGCRGRGFRAIRPASLAGAAWLLLWLPGGIWLGFVVGKTVADVFWYGAEAAARRGLIWSGLA